MEVRGRVYAIHVYDVGVRANLQAAAERLPGARLVRVVRHAPQGFAGSRAVPTAVTWTETGPPRVEGVADEIELRLYGFGAVAVTYVVPVSGPASTLVEVARTLHTQEALRPDGRSRVVRAAERLGDAVVDADISELGESYLVFEVQPEGTLDDFWSSEAAAVAQALRLESRAPRQEELEDTLGHGARTTVVDWFAALLVGEGREDERRVLELASAQLLQLRVLDQRLDRLLAEAHEALRHLRRGGFGRKRLDTIAQMQVDAAVHLEGVENALRFLGNRSLVQLHERIAARMQLDRWAASVQRKVDTLDAIYGKLADRLSHLPTEALQWVTIALIAISLAISLWKLG